MSRDFSGALKKKVPVPKSSRGPIHRVSPSYDYNTKVLFFHGKRIPISAVRGAYYMDEYNLVPVKRDLRRRIFHIGNDNVIMRESPAILTDRREHMRRDYVRFIRNLPNDEVEYLTLHYHDRWMWETDSSSDKESFEILIEERDLRKSEGWIVERPLMNEAKKTVEGIPVDEKTRLQLMLLLELKPLQPTASSSIAKKLPLAKDILTKFGIEQKKYLIDYLNGFLRREP